MSQRRARYRRVSAAVLLTVVVLGLLVASASRSDAAAYYVGGGKGVRLALRVVDRQVVWAKVRVEQHCEGSNRGIYHYSDFSEGLFGQAQIGRRGAFSVHSASRRVGHKGDEEISVRNISGRIGPLRLSGRLLQYGWFTSPEPPGVRSHGHCRGGGSSPPRARPTPVPITAHRRREPPGLDFYFSPSRGGITTYFEVEGRRIVRAEVAAVHFCVSRRGRHYREKLLSAFRYPIRIHPSGAFRVYEPPDEIRALEVLEGTVEPGRIVGSYGYDYEFAGDSPRCRTGSLEPWPGRSWALPFVARLR
jgi:hypothetical protein